MFMLKLIVALSVMGVLLYWGLGTETKWFQASALAKVLHLSALVSGGIAAYLGSLWLLGFRLRDFKRRAA
jgi:putative peptidoglycan lipid II flippase